MTLNEISQGVALIALATSGRPALNGTPARYEITVDISYAGDGTPQDAIVTCMLTSNGYLFSRTARNGRVLLKKSDLATGDTWLYLKSQKNIILKRHARVHLSEHVAVERGRKLVGESREFAGVRCYAEELASGRLVSVIWRSSLDSQDIPAGTTSRDGKLRSSFTRIIRREGTKDDLREFQFPLSAGKVVEDEKLYNELRGQFTPPPP